MGLLDFLKGGPATPPPPPFFAADCVPTMVHKRLADAKSGALPWVSTLTTPELSLARSHGMKMLATVASTCWMHYGYSWTEGHAQGWRKATERMQAEAALLGANAVIDVRMVTVPMDADASMDFSLVGTAIRIEGLPPSPHPIISTVPALEFIQLLDAGIVPVGIAVGARYDWTGQGQGLSYIIQRGYRASFQNQPMTNLTNFWERIRREAHADLRRDTARQGGAGVLAQLQFSQLFEQEADEEYPENTRYLGRHIVIGTVVDCKKGATVPQNISFALDMSDSDVFDETSPHHNSYQDGI